MHPAILEIAHKGVWIVVARLESDVKYLRTQPGDANETTDCQLVTVEIYDKGVTRSTFVHEERICIFVIPSTFLCKVPNVVMRAQGPYKSHLGIVATK